MHEFNAELQTHSRPKKKTVTRIYQVTTHATAERNLIPCAVPLITQSDAVQRARSSAQKDWTVVPKAIEVAHGTDITLSKKPSRMLRRSDKNWRRWIDGVARGWTACRCASRSVPRYCSKNHRSSGTSCSHANEREIRSELASWVKNGRRITSRQHTVEMLARAARIHSRDFRTLIANL